MPRISSRSIRAPLWQKDYDMLNSCSTLHPIQNPICYHSFSSKHKCFLNTLDKITEPSTFLEASKNKNWVSAMKEEIKALKDNKTWVLVPLPVGKHAI